MVMFETMFDVGDFLALCICLSMFFFIGCMRTFDIKLKNQFNVIISAMLIAILASMADSVLANNSVTTNFRYLTNILKQIAEGYLELQALLIVDRRMNKAKYTAYVLPFAISSVIISFAPFSELVFSFDEKNNMVRGNLGYIVYVEAIVYAIIILYICIKNWLKEHERDALVPIYVVALEFAGVILEITGIFKSAKLGCAAVGICFLYMYMYAVRYNVDSVSNCFKRRCFYSDGSRFGSHTMAVISMDLNDLKVINDNFGHKAGDKALLDFADICKSEMPKKFKLYRTGGDEFMMLGVRATKDEANAVIEAIKKKMKDTPYSCSFGVVMYRAGDDFDEIVVKADKAMYADKNEYKKNNKRTHSRDDDYSVPNNLIYKAE